MKIMQWGLKLFFFIAVLVAGYEGLYAARGDEKAPNVSVCDILRNPSIYAGKALTVTAHITSTKEGAYIWSPDCSKRGITLHFETKSGTGIADLYRELDKHGLGDHPIIATLTGIYMRDHYDDIRNLHYPIFSVIAATDVKRSRNVEHQ
jgi:hypothetical protein